MYLYACTYTHLLTMILATNNEYNLKELSCYANNDKFGRNRTFQILEPWRLVQNENIWNDNLSELPWHFTLVNQYVHDPVFIIGNKSEYYGNFYIPRDRNLCYSFHLKARITLGVNVRKHYWSQLSVQSLLTWQYKCRFSQYHEIITKTYLFKYRKLTSKKLKIFR